MAQKEGIPEAFLAYSAEDVVLLRNNTLIIGKEALKESYSNSESETGKVSLTWKPDFVDVASSGDLGYTYGKYVYTTTDSIGNKNVVEGIFHTVWKKQPDGKWKFVWD
jgi:ketosteroid isomerase-like protein